MDKDESGDEIDDPMPFGVRAAVTVWRIYGVIWLIVAIFGLTCGIVGLAMNIPPAACCIIPTPFLAIYSAVIRWECTDIFRGKSASFQGLTGLSTALGLLHLAPASGLVCLLLHEGGPKQLLRWESFAVIGALWTPGCMLTAAGLLAYRNANNYHEWVSRRQNDELNGVGETPTR